ncbi:hypothetical protein FRB99_004851 [Tulasnella sp. 403]|nr:hypothetical protein FRB99_004851 [Tulasnella sp. 403]
MRPLGRLRTAFLCIIVSLLYLSFVGWWRQGYLLASLSTHRPSNDTGLNVPPTRDLAAGHWAPYSPPAYEVELWTDNNCRIDWSDGEDKHDIPKEMKQRADAVNGWEWVFEDGVSVQTWNATAFVERMVQNRFGMLVIGDSLSNQMLAALGKMLGSPNGQGVALTGMRMHTDRWLDKGYVNRTDIFINPHHPAYKLLQQQYPHIPPERFREPIAIGIRTDILLTDDELSIVMHEVGYDSPIREHFRSQGNWRGMLQHFTKVGGWEGEHPGIAIINTGAHWNPGYMKPAKGEHLILAYSKALKIVTDEMQRFSEKMPMRVFYRAVSPGHEGCKEYHAPLSAADPITQLVEARTNAFGWELFPRYNDLARKSFSLFYEGGSDGISYWGIWNMSVVRPDAHIGFSGKFWDCMHWCSPSVPEWWIKTLWHAIVEQRW